MAVGRSFCAYGSQLVGCRHSRREFGSELHDTRIQVIPYDPMSVDVDSTTLTQHEENKNHCVKVLKQTNLMVNQNSNMYHAPKKKKTKHPWHLNALDAGM